MKKDKWRRIFLIAWMIAVHIGSAMVAGILGMAPWVMVIGTYMISGGIIAFYCRPLAAKGAIKIIILWLPILWSDRMLDWAQRD